MTTSASVRDSDLDETPATKPVPHRIGFAIVALFLLGVIVLLPFSLGSVIGEIVTPQFDHIYPLSTSTPLASASTRLNLNVVAVDEWDRTATIRVSGQHNCDTGCPFQDQLILVSIPPNVTPNQGMPPSQTIMLPNKSQLVTQDVKLQVTGDPVRYPFDRYHLTLAAILQRVFPDGTTQSLDGAAGAGALSLTMQMQAPRIVISSPQIIDTASVPSAGPLYNWVYISSVTFSRPVYLQVLSVLLVLLVTAAAVYAVFMRPLDQLLQNVGALVLGVWGIRAILLGTSLTGVTAIDLSLIAVVLFLLGTISFRAMLFLQRRAGISLRAR